MYASDNATFVIENDLIFDSAIVAHTIGTQALKGLQSVALKGKLSPRNLQDRISSSRVTNVPRRSRIFEGRGRRRREIVDSTKSTAPSIPWGTSKLRNYCIQPGLVIACTSGDVYRKCRGTRGTNRAHSSSLLIKLQVKPISVYKL